MMLLADENKRSLLGRQAQDAVSLRFSLNRMVDEIERIYAKVE